MRVRGVEFRAVSKVRNGSNAVLGLAAESVHCRSGLEADIVGVSHGWLGAPGRHLAVAFNMLQGNIQAGDHLVMDRSLAYQLLIHRVWRLLYSYRINP